MKRKSVAAFCLAGCMVTTSLTGCGTGELTKNVAEAVAGQQGNEDKVVEKDVQEKSSDIKDEAEKDKDVEDKDAEDKDDKDEEDQDKEDKDKEKEEEDKDAEDKDDKKDSKKSTSDKGLGEKYVDFDNMAFAIHGKVYQLGKTTLAEMLEDEVAFSQDDINNAQNNLNPNAISNSFNIRVDGGYRIRLYMGNLTQDNKKVAECPVTEVDIPLRAEIDKDLISFAFPHDVTEEELKKNAGEPARFDEYESDDEEYEYVSHTYSYQKDSDIYLLGKEYEFRFVNGEIDNLRMIWLP